MITTKSASARISNQNDLIEQSVNLATPSREWLSLLIGYLLLFVVYLQWIEPWIQPYLVGSDCGWMEFLRRLHHREL